MAGWAAPGGAARQLPRRRKRRAGGRRKFSWPRAELTPTRATSATRLAAPSALSRRLRRVAPAVALSAVWSPSRSGTAPPGASREKRTPSTAVATPVSATTPTSTSFARASRRSGGESRRSSRLGGARARPAARDGEQRQRVDRPVAPPGRVDELAALALVGDRGHRRVQGEPAEEVAAEQAREAEVVGGAADLRKGERRCRYGSHFLGLAV